MKYNNIPMILLVFLLSSCVAHHSYKLQGDSLVFLYENTDASEVQFACSADKYMNHQTVQTRKNLWSVSVPAMDEISYFYIVDGAVTLPERCRYTELDDFGSRNCLYVRGM